MDWSAWVGLPYEEGGRGPRYDCWGLARAAFEAGTGHELASHADGYQTGADRAEIDALLMGARGDWREVRREQMFDMAVMVGKGRYHIGIVVSPGSMLHVQRDQLSTIVPLKLRPMLAGLYRHRLFS